MPHAEHPLVAAHGADAAADLIRECLERKPMICRSECGRERVARPVRFLRGLKKFDRILEPPRKQMLVTVERDDAALPESRARRQMETMNRVEEEERTDSLVEVLRCAPEGIERCTLREK